MITTNCKEIAGVECTVPLSGNTLDELKKNVFAHAQQDHKEILAKMAPADLAKLPQKIEAIYKQKTSGVTARS